MIRIIRVERIMGKFEYPAGDIFDFETAYDASVFLLGCQIRKYLIVKDGYVFRPSTFEVTLLEKELDLFNGAKNIIKPCPCCNSTAVDTWNDSVFCKRCGIQTAEHESIERAVEVWNTRAGVANTNFDSDSQTRARNKN